MKWTVIILFTFLCATSSWAGTFRDNFEDGNINNWQKWEWPGQNTGKLEEKNGMLVMTDVNSAFDTAADFNNSQHIGNFTLTLELKMAKAFEGNSSFAQILFRGVEQNKNWRLGANSYYASGEAFLNIFTLIDGNAKEIGKQKLPFDFKVGAWYSIRLDVNGEQVTLWIDDQLIQEVDWEKHGVLPDAGIFQLSVGGGESHCDNFVITSDDIRSVQTKSMLTITWGRLKH